MVSIVILTKNEEKNILDCLESVSWADEIIIIDDFSEDRTVEVIKTFYFNKKIKIFNKKLENDFSAQRNYALSKTTKDWVFFVDADERVTKELREEINTLLIEEKNDPKHDGFYIKRKDIIWGKKLEHGESGNIKILRLGKKNAGIWRGRVHEEWGIELKTGELESHLLHYPHQSVDEFLKEINFYTTLRAQELYENKIKPGFFDVILYPKGKFIKNYFVKLGFLDGIEGLIFAVLMSFHSFLVRGKLWLLWQK